MVLKLVQKIQNLALTGQRLRTFPGALHLSRLSTLSRKPACPVCLWTGSRQCTVSQGGRQLQYDYGRMGLSTIGRDPLLFSPGSVSLHGDATSTFQLTLLYPPDASGDQAFADNLTSCRTSRHVLKLLQAAETMSDTMAAAALLRVADLEEGEDELKDPKILNEDVIKALFLQLEHDSTRLTDWGLVSALLACTRLHLDPWSTLMVRLISESQERLDRGCLTITQLCTLAEVLLALEGPSCVILDQIMDAVKEQEPKDWSIQELTRVYDMLQAGVGKGVHYQDLLKSMNSHAISIASRLDPTSISTILNALMVLKMTKAVPLAISLCEQSAQYVPHFTDEQLTQVLGAFIHFGLSDPNFVEAVERHIPSVAFTAHPETITKVMQYFGRRNLLSLPIFDAVAESFVYRSHLYNTSQITRQIMPFGKLGYLPPNAGALFHNVEAIVRSRFSQFLPRSALNLLHSCTLVERFPVTLFAKVFDRSFLQQLQAQGTGVDWNVLAQLTQLDLTVKLECPHYEGPSLQRSYKVKSIFTSARSLETPLDGLLYTSVDTGLVELLGGQTYFSSRVTTPYLYTLDVEIKIDKGGYVLPAHHSGEVYRRVALCIDGPKRFSSITRQLLGKETIKQRHLWLLGYDVVQIPFYEFKDLKSQAEKIEYLHKKIFPHSCRLSW
ncbi:FAST kinase domain-containing protein 3, mitochondrial [Conger conger]|uniref:FAST kinase domain-containing protein 3, mitochondrial n=1 Tax=Conger conger TaxID=82655 RepID=UPI002A5A3955|nr:FAST kinase domain-containing protein 3, mitochondrial [Conger conger]